MPLSIDNVTYCPNALIGVVVYSRTSAGSEPVYVTRMHRVTTSLGFAPVMVYIAAFASLSEITTVPAAKLSPAFTVVAENAAYVPMLATVPTTPTSRSDRSVLRPRLIRSILLMPDPSSFLP